MTRFLDGPCQTTLMLHRAPVFLRVVEDNGKWDALDNPDDQPRLTENIHVYIREGGAWHCHVQMAKKGGGRTGGFYTGANYRHYPMQPSDQDARDPQKWVDWCNSQIPALFA